MQPQRQPAVVLSKAGLLVDLLLRLSICAFLELGIGLTRG